MNSEMMEALENIEREKGISIEIMLEALAERAASPPTSACPTRPRRRWSRSTSRPARSSVIAQELDEDGNVVREWDDTPDDFGRIAAQTAKQVILQRIREAEREMKYEEYAGREGDIVTGIIQQTDARYTLLDLGKVEALLPAGRAGARTSATSHGTPAEGLHRRGAQDRQGPADRRVAAPTPASSSGCSSSRCPRSPTASSRSRPSPASPATARRSRSASNDHNVDPVGACVGARGVARAHGRQRAARREGRHRPVTATTRPSS